MNTEIPSVVANRMYAFGETYAQAKAWAVANLGAVGAEIDNVQANITTLGGQALSARAISWYDRNSLFADVPASSPNVQPVPGLDLQGQDGNVLEVSNGSWKLGAAGGGGLTGVGAFGSTPNANGASVSGSNLVLQPADLTHPGAVTTGTQTFGGQKTFDICNAQFVADIGLGWGGLKFASVSGVGYYAGGANLVVMSSGNMLFYIGGLPAAVLSGSQFDLTNFGAGGSIKLKSPDGTVYTLSIANGGTVHIV